MPTGTPAAPEKRSSQLSDTFKGEPSMNFRTVIRDPLLTVVAVAMILIGVVAGLEQAARESEPEPAERPAPVAVAHPDDAYENAGGGDAWWGWRACQVREAEHIYGEELARWLWIRYDEMTMAQAEIIVELSGKHLCPGSVPSTSSGESRMV